MSTPSRPIDRALLFKLGVVILAGLLLLLLVLRGVDVRGLIDRGLGFIRAAGPVTFFGAMLILPGCGAPMLTFTLPAVSLFGPTLGTPLVVVLALLALTGNLIITYALARRALRPLLEKLCVKFGYKLPEADAGDATDLVILLRVTPGVPFMVQNYLSGLANIPFGRYLLVSCLVAWPQAIAFMLFGDALMHGKGKLALIGLCSLMALTAGTHMVRKHYERKKKSQT